MFAESRVAGDVEHEDRYIALDFPREFGRIRVDGGEELHGLGDELGEVITETGHLVHPRIDGGLHAQGRAHPREQLLIIHRLGEEIICARLDSLDAIIDAV